MSKVTKAVDLARIEDATLGAFARVPTSETLDHLVRYLSTWSGSDKLFMIIQYALKIIVPFLHLRARLQHRSGLRKEPVSSVAPRLEKLGSLIGDARMLANIWGLLPIVQWLTNLERNPPPTRKLLTIERLQGWAMLGYYLLEHLYYLVSHSIIPAQLPRPSLSSEPKDKVVNLDTGALSRLSTRFWAVYVFLQLAHLREDHRLLKIRERTLGKSKANTAQAEKEELIRRWDALWSQVIVNLSYLPLTIHWSIEGGLFKNDIWVGLLGLSAALASWRSGWKATAIPPPPAAPVVEPMENEKLALDTTADRVTDADMLAPSEVLSTSDTEP
ncbi:hypothetical protein K474DRAFT_1772045 [Panus rudis PR-1116 ss-1]|nr:hypothetical protein K474DRAFT_1772045 [Panus rudis PR-1116 ss-1]